MLSTTGPVFFQTRSLVAIGLLLLSGGLFVAIFSDAGAAPAVVLNGGDGCKAQLQACTAQLHVVDRQSPAVGSSHRSGHVSPSHLESPGERGGGGFVDPSGTCPDYGTFLPLFEQWLRWWRHGTLTSDNVTALFYGRFDSLGLLTEQLQREMFNAQSRFTIVDGKLYYARNPNGFDYRERAIDVLRQIAHLLPWAAGLGIPIPDVDLIYNVNDAPTFDASFPLPAPSHAMATSPLHSDVPIPDMSFLEWPENGVGEEQAMNYSTLMGAIMDAGSHATRPYRKRVRKAVFRGAINEAYIERWQAAEEAKKHRDILSFNTYGEGPLSLRNHSKFALQVAIPGNGWMARLKYALATGSPVVMLQAGRDNGLWTEWWYPLLRPYVDYWPIQNVRELPRAVRYLLDHPAEAEAIGRNGQGFVAQRLSETAVRCYWAYYLHFLGTRFKRGGVRVDRRMMLVPDSSVEAIHGIYYKDWSEEGVREGSSEAEGADAETSAQGGDSEETRRRRRRRLVEEASRRSLASHAIATDAG